MSTQDDMMLDVWQAMKPEGRQALISYWGRIVEKAKAEPEKLSKAEIVDLMLALQGQSHALGDRPLPKEYVDYE